MAEESGSDDHVMFLVNYLKEKKNSNVFFSLLKFGFEMC